MKKLTRMKLINWHRFENCWVDFNGSTLISGENGAGKSTLLDAVQYVLLCSTNSFNVAAHEGGKRKLSGYVRAKSGKEGKPYERTGQISSHVALEFHEEKADAYFIVGAVIDSEAEGQDTSAWYLINNARLEDGMFFKENIPRSISQFRAFNKNIKQWCKTQAEARKVIATRLGRLDSKFYRLIPKALGFRPINDIKDFVYSYVLDAKEVNIGQLRENVRSYQELERTLESVKQRIEKLELIDRYHTDVEDCLKRDRMYAYFLVRAQAGMQKDEIESIKERMQSEAYRLEEARAELKSKASHRDRLQDLETNLRVELRQNADFVALEAKKKELDQLRSDERAFRSEVGELKALIKDSLAQTEKLLGAMESEVELQKLADARDAIGKYREIFDNVDAIGNIAEAKEAIEKLIALKRKMYGQVQTTLAKERIAANSIHEEYQRIKRRIADLERKKLSYSQAVEYLLDALKEEMLRLNRDSSPHVLCELLDISDEEWRNAVEGYLNTQRFYVLTEPENFDVALSIYDRLRRLGKVYGAGLINTQKMQEYDAIPENSLATKVVTKNMHARRYINMVLGKVRLCERVEDLKKYPVSITKECMRYQNRVASAIKPEIFREPYIGQQAYKVQLAQARDKEKELKGQAQAVALRIRKFDYILEALPTDNENSIKYKLDALVRLRGTLKAIAGCEESIRNLQGNTTVRRKQRQLDDLERARRELEGKIAAANQEIGRMEERIAAGKDECAELEAGVVSLEAQLEELALAAGDDGSVWDKEYGKQTARRTLQRFHEVYERQRKANATSKDNAEKNMRECMVDYKMAYDFGAAATVEGFPEFAAIYERLRTSELLEYEGKVQEARGRAELEFQEQFLAKLQENIKEAQGEFKNLNRALKGITFSNDHYEFTYRAGSRNEKYYNMIMDDFNVAQGESIFTGSYHEAHKEEIEELFERLALDNENNEKALAEYTDYRSYMDYDIKIFHGDGSFSYYSKVCEEKSGGETQTPFYVTVAASFVQLYGSCIGDEAPGIVMFDEAFNNMDDERIGGVLEFMNRLPLQIIISAPPTKIQYIAPAMDATLLVMTDERLSFIEEYHNRAKGQQDRAV